MARAFGWCGAAPDNVRALFADGDEEPPDIELPPEQWLPAAGGLVTVRGLRAHLTAHPDAAADVDRLIEHLRQFEEVLGQLDAAGVRWHLAVDF